MCVLDNTDMSKHVSDVDSITRPSSESEKQILFQTEKKMNKYPQTNNVKTLNSPTVRAAMSPDPHNLNTSHLVLMQFCYNKMKVELFREPVLNDTATRGR